MRRKKEECPPPPVGGKIGKHTVKGATVFLAFRESTYYQQRFAHSRGRKNWQTYSKRCNGIFGFSGIDLLPAAVRRPLTGDANSNDSLSLEKFFLQNKGLQVTCGGSPLLLADHPTFQKKNSNNKKKQGSGKPHSL